MAKKYELTDAKTTLWALNLSRPTFRVISHNYNKQKKTITIVVACNCFLFDLKTKEACVCETLLSFFLLVGTRKGQHLHELIKSLKVKLLRFDRT